MKQKYVIAPYMNTYGMYEKDDFRLKKYTTVIQGIFKKDKNIKGWFNGHEIGVFYSNNGKEYVIFTDHSARLKTQ